MWQSMIKAVVWVAKGYLCFFRTIRTTLHEISGPRFLQHQRCKVCGRRDKFNFHVPDKIWESIVPKKLQNRVICLACFDRFAKERGVDYAPYLSGLCFAGDQTSLQLQVVTCNCSPFSSPDTLHNSPVVGSEGRSSYLSGYFGQFEQFEQKCQVSLPFFLR